MSPLAQVTEVAQGGGVDEEVTDDHEGSPERLNQNLDNSNWEIFQQHT
jgi:hypothetical protein